MTNEGKFLKLLRIAKKNGFKEAKYYIDALENGEVNEKFCQIEEHQIITKNQWKMYSINDIVANFEPNKVSFIEALCTETLRNEKKSLLILSTLNVELATQRMRSKWVLQPTSERLSWLFDVFNHLINE